MTSNVAITKKLRVHFNEKYTNSFGFDLFILRVIKLYFEANIS